MKFSPIISFFGVLEVKVERKKKTQERGKKPTFKTINRKFFINWYAGELLAHGERLADAAVSVFGLAENVEEEGRVNELKTKQTFNFCILYFTPNI